MSLIHQNLSLIPRFQAVSRQVSEAFRSRGRRVVVVVLVEVAGTLLVGNALYQDYYANMYALGFRLVVS